LGELSAALGDGALEPGVWVEATDRARGRREADSQVEVAGVGGVSRRALGDLAGPLVDLVGRIRLLGYRDGLLPKSPTREAWEALAEGRLDDARRIAAGGLADLPADPQERRDEGGDGVHSANLVLGHLALLEGAEEQAEQHLLASVDTVASPWMYTFGPNMALALALFRRHRIDTVRAYLRACAAFWGDPNRLAEWEAALDRGLTPIFGANLVYGQGDGRVARCGWCKATEVEAGRMAAGPSGARICGACVDGARRALRQSEQADPGRA
jgi:hypothetical protein